MADPRPMRISLVVPRYLPHLGGIENHVSALATRLQSRGHHITVATQLHGQEALPRREVDDRGVTVLRFPASVQLRGQGLSPALRRWVHDGADGADVIHLHNYHALASLVVLLGASVRAPVLFTPHYMGPEEGTAEHLMHRAFAAGMRRALRAADRIICTTRAEAAAFTGQVGFGDRCVVISNGVDTADIRAAKPLPRDAGRLIVAAGRFEEYKQQQLLIESLPFLPRDDRLALIGAGPMEDALRQRAVDLGVADRVAFPGRMSTSELYRWYRTADVVVSLSRREGFGLTVAEGLAAGAAVVASDIGAHWDVFALAGAPTAELVPVTARPEQVAGALAEARPLLSGIRLPDWDDMTAATVACYEELLRR